MALTTNTFSGKVEEKHALTEQELATLRSNGTLVVLDGTKMTYFFTAERRREILKILEEATIIDE
jgi:predicted RNA-binding protein associated with RNAse of E/G family